MELLVVVISTVVAAGLLMRAAVAGYKLWRTAMRDERVLMHEVLQRQGVTLNACADAAVLVESGKAIRRCMLCGERAACLAWLAGEAPGLLERFCPNAGLIARLRAVQKRASTTSIE